MADEFGKKELGYDPAGYGPGYDPGYGPGYGPGCGPVQGEYYYQKLQKWIGTSVTAVFTDGSIIRGSLHTVGVDYAEIHRSRDTAREAVFVPLQSTAIIGPIR